MNSSLSQKEVDALLNGITGESEQADDEFVPPGATRKYDLASQDRIVRGRMPTMEIVMERFARNIRQGLFNFLHKNAIVSIGSVKLQK
ncbi:MAG: flagellar motor switch protein FliM, partial [Caldimonas sp.]